jgi:hypothetical protein
VLISNTANATLKYGSEAWVLKQGDVDTGSSMDEVSVTIIGYYKTRSPTKYYRHGGKKLTFSNII